MPAPLSAPWYVDIIAIITGLATLVGAWRVLRRLGPIVWLFGHLTNDLKENLREVILETTGKQLSTLLKDNEDTKKGVKESQESIKEIELQLNYNSGSSVKDMIKKNGDDLSSLYEKIEERFDHIDKRSHATEGVTHVLSGAVSNNMERLHTMEKKIDKYVAEDFVAHAIITEKLVRLTEVIDIVDVINQAAREGLVDRRKIDREENEMTDVPVEDIPENEIKEVGDPSVPSELLDLHTQLEDIGLSPKEFKEVLENDSEISDKG